MREKKIVRYIQLGLVLLVSSQLLGCLVQNDIDRFECLNRPIYNLNKKMDTYALKPLARIYEGVLPKQMRQMVGNFFQNLSEVPTVGNDLLQGQFAVARQDTARFLLNSTWGIGGLFDVAAKGGAKGGIPRHHQDFGLTLAKWGYRNSSYIVIPFFGPSTVRDGIGKLATYNMSIPAHLKRVRWRNRLFGLSALDTRASLLKAEPAIDEAVDEYVFVRDAYMQHREFEITGEKHHETEDSVMTREKTLQGPPE